MRAHLLERKCLNATTRTHRGVFNQSFNISEQRLKAVSIMIVVTETQLTTACFSVTVSETIAHVCPRPVIVVLNRCEKNESANMDFSSLLLSCRTIYHEAEYEFWKRSAIVKFSFCWGLFAPISLFHNDIMENLYRNFCITGLR